MYFKLMQAFVALITAVITLFAPQTPSQGIEPENPPVNVNPNPVSESVTIQDVKIMSYNLKIDGSGIRAVEKRAVHILNTMNEKKPDSIGVQEADKNWVETLAEGLPEYAHIEKYRDDGIEKGESSAIFYLKNKYNLIDSGHFWLSETPDKPSVGWDAACLRICTYAILENKESGFTYAHFNVHFDHVGEKAQAESVSLITAKIASIAPDIPVVLTGDFNVAEGSDNYNALVECGLKDTKYLAKKADNHATYHGYNVIYPSTKPIDFVFVNGYVSAVKSSRIDSGFIDHILASDHFPLTVEMTLFNGGAK